MSQQATVTMPLRDYEAMQDNIKRLEQAIEGILKNDFKCIMLFDRKYYVKNDVAETLKFFNH